jgi:hypothetical protein
MYPEQRAAVLNLDPSPADAPLNSLHQPEFDRARAYVSDGTTDANTILNARTDTNSNGTPKVDAAGAGAGAGVGDGDGDGDGDDSVRMSEQPYTRQPRRKSLQKQAMSVRFRLPDDPDPKDPEASV